MSAEAVSVRELQREWKNANSDPWAPVAVKRQTEEALLTRSRELMLALPVRVGINKAPGPFGAVHIRVLENLHVGRLRRPANFLLCGSGHLAGLLPTVGAVTCLRCLEIAERMREKGRKDSDGQ